MKIRIDRVRMAMQGRCYAYDCVVPVSEVDESKFNYFILRDGGKYVLYTEATLPASYAAMPTGLARYDAYHTHERVANLQSAELIRRAFPEVGSADPHHIVELPEFDATHATVYMTD